MEALPLAQQLDDKFLTAEIGAIVAGVYNLMWLYSETLSYGHAIAAALP